MVREKKKILLVEDDLFLSRAYTSALTNEGFTVIGATDGVEAMERAKLERPDLILLDLILPRKNGFEFMEDIKKDDELKDIPILVFSVLDQARDIEKAKALGALDYIVKSRVSLKDAVEKIREYL